MKLKRRLTTTVLLITIVLGIYVVIPTANFLSTNSNSNILSNEPKPSEDYDTGGYYDWSNFTDYTYRIPLEINSTFIDRTDYSVKVEVNFTQALIDAQYSGQEFDVKTVRVVEYELATYPYYYPKLFNDSESLGEKYILPSLFIPLSKYDNYHAVTNAYGQLWFEMPGTSDANTNRTFMVYFDTIENGPNDAPAERFVWDQDYNYGSDVIGDKMYHLAYGSYQEEYGISRGALSVWNEDMTEYMYYGRPHSDIQRYLYPVPGDFNGDGEVELLVSDRDNQFWLMDYYETTGIFSPLPTTNGDPFNFDTVTRNWITALAGVTPYRWSVTHNNIFAADMDLDGSDEIIATTYDRDYCYIFIYNITIDESQNHILQVQNYINTTIAESGILDIQAMSLADLDNDGYMDIIGGENDGNSGDVNGYTLYFWMNEGDGTFTHFNVSQRPRTDRGYMLPQEVRGISTGDIDNDGNIEVVVTNDENYRYLYIWQWDKTNTTDFADGTMEWEGTYDVPIDSSFREPVIGAMYDWDYDGYTEIVIGNSDTGYNSSIMILEVKGNEIEYSGNSRFKQQDEWGTYGNLSVQYQNMYYPRFGDVDNDGRVEMFSGSYRKYEGANIYEPSVLVWNNDSISPEWISPAAYNTIGSGSLNTQMMMTVFGGWDNYVYRQEPMEYVHEAKARDPDLTITVLDMDHGPVSNAEVIVTKGLDIRTATSNENGKVNFALLDDGTYDIQINYETPYYAQQEVYSSTVDIDSGTELYTEATYVTPLQKIYFNVTDPYGDFTSGDLVVWDDTVDGTVGMNKSLGTGMEEFVWIVQDSAAPRELTVQYTNDQYNMISNYIVNGTITPESNDTTLAQNFDDGTELPLGGNFYKYIYDFENVSSLNWIDIDVDISGATHYIDNIEVELVHESDEEQVYYEDIAGSSTDTWSRGISLWEDVFERSTTVRVTIEIYNTTTNSGSVDVDLYYEAVEQISVPFERTNLLFIDEEEEAAEGFQIEISNTTTGVSLVNLTTNEFGEALDSQDGAFYYFDDTEIADYNMTAFYYKTPIQINESDYQIFVNDETDTYHFNVSINIGEIEYETTIEILSFNDLIDYDENLVVTINVTATTDVGTFAIDAIPEIIIFSVDSGDPVFNSTMASGGPTGLYTVTFNPDYWNISLGTNDYEYYFTIDAETPEYGSGPEQVVDTFTIDPISTSAIADTAVTMTWSRDDSFTFTYLDGGASPLENASVVISEKWATATEIGSGVYNISVNTEGSGNAGEYYLQITAGKENYQSQVFGVNLTINPLPTSLNGSDASDFLVSSGVVDVYLTETYLVYFDYTIADTGDGIEGALVTCSVDGETGSNDDYPIIDVGNGVYLLDYETETLPEGTYDFEIKFEKANHGAKVASITLDLIKNTFAYDITEGDVVNDILKFTVDNGQDQIITIDLTQVIDGAAALNATVQYDGVDFTHDGNGVYTYTVKSGEVNTFIQKGLVEGVVTISQEYYEDIIFTVQVTVKMHALIPGFPTFYMVLAVSFIMVGVGAIVLTKVVQNARIPLFVKKCDAVAKEISKKKTIDTRTNVALTKAEKLAEIFGKDWENLGLDFRVSMGYAPVEKFKSIGDYAEATAEPEPEPYTEPEPEPEPEPYTEPEPDTETDEKEDHTQEDEY